MHMYCLNQAKALARGMLGWHAGAVAEMRRRREEAARKRVEALKSSDMTVRRE